MTWHERSIRAWDFFIGALRARHQHLDKRVTWGSPECTIKLVITSQVVVTFDLIRSPGWPNSAHLVTNILSTRIRRTGVSLHHSRRHVITAMGARWKFSDQWSTFLMIVFDSVLLLSEWENKRFKMISAGLTVSSILLILKSENYGGPKGQKIFSNVEVFCWCETCWNILFLLHFLCLLVLTQLHTYFDWCHYMLTYLF